MTEWTVSSSRRQSSIYIYYLTIITGSILLPRNPQPPTIPTSSPPRLIYFLFLPILPFWLVPSFCYPSVSNSQIIEFFTKRKRRDPSMPRINNYWTNIWSIISLCLILLLPRWLQSFPTPFQTPQSN